MSPVSRIFATKTCRCAAPSDEVTFVVLAHYVPSPAALLDLLWALLDLLWLKAGGEAEGGEQVGVEEVVMPDDPVG